ncbi:MAG: DUF1566 domain-containing protein [Treponema sp.]|nr:DUF1566 domain-containing protein [Treponema sp.]
MKKYLFFILAIFICTGLFAQRQPTVAVAPFEVISGIGANEANGILRVFNIMLANSRALSLVDRNVVENVFREYRWQTDDWSDPNKTAELGKALNADWIVLGQIERSSSNTLITVSFYNVQTFKLMVGTYVQYPNNAYPFDHIEPLMNKLVETISANPIDPSPRPTKANRTYKIGDTGPADGIVFYDKGTFSDGWQYLEAAPASTEFKAEWGAHLQNVSGTDTAVGSGKQNTQLIVAYLNNRGENNRAAQICTAMNINGFTDWFLPSKDELDLMYVNLEKNSLGSFELTWYWSSSHANTYTTWYQRFSDGYQGYYSKINTYSVRAVRAF